MVGGFLRWRYRYRQRRGSNWGLEWPQLLPRGTRRRDGGNHRHPRRHLGPDICPARGPGRACFAVGDWPAGRHLGRRLDPGGLHRGSGPDGGCRYQVPTRRPTAAD